MPDSDTSRSLCVFCGSRADSKEHIFALSLCKRAGDINYAVIAGLSVEGKENVTRNRHPIQALKVRRVCKPCNKLWMSELETWFLSRLGFLIEPQWPQQALTLIEELKPERNRLAHWLMKTAVTFSHTTLESEHPVEFSYSVTQRIKDGILPANCWVDLAYSKSKTFGATLTRCFRVKNGERYNPSLLLPNGDGFKFIVQFNHLLLRIAQAPEADVICQSQHGEIPVRLYPMPCPQTPDNFAYEDIMGFENSIILDTWDGCRGNIG